MKTWYYINRSTVQIMGEKVGLAIKMFLPNSFRWAKKSPLLQENVNYKAEGITELEIYCSATLIKWQVLETIRLTAGGLILLA